MINNNNRDLKVDLLSWAYFETKKNLLQFTHGTETFNPCGDSTKGLCYTSAHKCHLFCSVIFSKWIKRSVFPFIIPTIFLMLWLQQRRNMFKFLKILFHRELNNNNIGLKTGQPDILQESERGKICHWLWGWKKCKVLQWTKKLHHLNSCLDDDWGIIPEALTCISIESGRGIHQPSVSRDPFCPVHSAAKDNA